MEIMEKKGKRLQDRNNGCLLCQISANSIDKKVQYEVEMYVSIKSKDIISRSLQSHEVETINIPWMRSRKMLTGNDQDKSSTESSTTDTPLVSVKLINNAHLRNEYISLMSSHEDYESFACMFLCEKNPGHKNSIPAKRFSRHLLPKEVRTKKIYHCIKLMCPLTVKLEMNLEKIETDMEKKLQRKMGSGSLYITKNYHKYTTCPCEECLNSNKPSVNFRCVWITTALHVVENDEQAKATLVTVDYDDENSKVILLKGHRLVNKDLEADRCILECVTHNVRFYNKVRKLRKKIRKLERSLKIIYSKTCPNLAVVISHPHGRPKRVSIGKIKEKIVVDQPDTGVQKTYFKHDVPTCPGSSGAVLWILGFERIGYMDRGITDHTHSMGAEGNENFSGQGIEKDFPLIDGIISHNHVHV